MIGSRPTIAEGGDDFKMGAYPGATRTGAIAIDTQCEPGFRRRVDTPAHEYSAILANIGELVSVARHESGEQPAVVFGAALL